MAGGRVACELAGEEGGIVRYAVELTASSAWRGTATIELKDGAVDVSVEGAPAWLVELARKFLRDEWRARQPREPGRGTPSAEGARESGRATETTKAPSPWPRRINRWREGP